MLARKQTVLAHPCQRRMETRVAVPSMPYVADVRWLRPVHFHGDVHDDRGEYDCEWYSTMNFFTNLVQPYIAEAVAKNRRGALL